MTAIDTAYRNIVILTVYVIANLSLLFDFTIGLVSCDPFAGAKSFCRKPL